MTNPIGLPDDTASTRRIVIVLLDVCVPPRPMWYWPSDIRTLRFSLTSLVPVPKPALAGWNEVAACCAAVVMAAFSDPIHKPLSVASLGSCGVVIVWFECTQMLAVGVPVAWLTMSLT